MGVHIVLIFSFLLASVFVSASPHSPVNHEKCFEENIHYIGLPLNKPGENNNYGPTGSAEGCQFLCQQTDGCVWFNWEGEDKCWLKTGRGNQSKRKFGGVTGPRICPTTNTTTTSTTSTTNTTTTKTTSTTTTAYGMCGIEKKYEGKRRRISGGIETRPNQYPWMVRIHDGPSPGCEQFCILSGGGDCENSCKLAGCGGSLITDRHVLTAKHCLKDAKYVKVGVHNQSDPRDYKIFKIKNDVTHTADDDIAIIILETPVDLNDETIGTVCLPTNADQDYKRKEVLALGWGWTPGHFQSMVLQHVGLTVAGGHRNDAEYLLFTEGSRTPSGVPIDVCKGDSGGPLLYKQDGRWSIIATVKGGPWCNDPNPDRPDGIWNKVTYHLDWIKKVIQDQN